jgi:hypothetical protein
VFLLLNIDNQCDVARLPELSGAPLPRERNGDAKLQKKVGNFLMV